MGGGGGVGVGVLGGGVDESSGEQMPVTQISPMSGINGRKFLLPGISTISSGKSPHSHSVMAISPTSSVCA
jgi:hypothetical protein